MLMPERFGGGDYRYGYQSSEKDNKVKSEGNSYTTYFRQLDPRLGRWLTIDPKATAWESPYVSMGNMPIWANDPLGDKFKKQKHKDKLVKKIGERKNEIESNIKTLEENISKINSKLSIADISSENCDELQKEKSKYQNELSEQNLMLGEMNEALKEIKEMDKSEVLFVTRRNLFSWSQTGYTNSLGNNKQILIKFGNYKSAIHEFHHGYQFLTGDITFSFQDAVGNGAYDIQDELDAFYRDYSFNPKEEQFPSGKIIKAYLNQRTEIKISRTRGRTIDNASSLKGHISVSKNDSVYR